MARSCLVNRSGTRLWDFWTCFLGCSARQIVTLTSMVRSLILSLRNLSGEGHDVQNGAYFLDWRVSLVAISSHVHRCIISRPMWLYIKTCSWVAYAWGTFRVSEWRCIKHTPLDGLHIPLFGREHSRHYSWLTDVCNDQFFDEQESQFVKDGRH